MWEPKGTQHLLFSKLYYNFKKLHFYGDIKYYVFDKIMLYPVYFFLIL